MGVVSAAVRFMAHFGPQTRALNGLIIYIYHRAHETVTSATAKTNPFKINVHSDCRAKSQSKIDNKQIIENADTIAKVRPRAPIMRRSHPSQKIPECDCCKDDE